MSLPSIIKDGKNPSMIDVYIDFESYYDSECSLSRLSTLEYLWHPKFEVIGMGIAFNSEDPEWYMGDDIADVLKGIPWERTRLIAHNMGFDGAIVQWVYGHTPREFFCTMMGSRPHIVPFSHSMSLDKVGSYIGSTAKGTFVHNAKGLRASDFTPAQLAEYSSYCRMDVRICRDIYNHLAHTLTEDEMRMIHLTTGKGLLPQMRVDVPMLQQALVDEVVRKQLVLQRAGVSIDDIMSNPKLAQVLRTHGVEPPMKVSPTTGKRTYAFAKDDLEFTELQDHPNEEVALLVQARLGAKSTIEESRLKRFIAVGSRLEGQLPFPLLYYGAHTGRASGADKMNLQNLTKKSALRRAITAPPGYKLVVSDLSQIEARMVAWLAGQEDMVNDFRAKQDVYSIFGTRVFGRQVSKATPEDRFVSKVGVLSLMYGSGAAKFEHTVNSSGQAVISPVVAEQVVSGYRDTYANIKKLWYLLDKILTAMIAGKPVQYKCMEFKRVNGAPAVVMPGCRVMYYPELYVDASNEKFYRGNKGFWKKIYGGAFLENISQALSQIIIKDTELRMAELFKYRVLACGQVHDELIYCVPEKSAEKFAARLTIEMTRAPEWAPEFPLDCETKVVDCYADAK